MKPIYDLIIYGKINIPSVIGIYFIGGQFINTNIVLNNVADAILKHLY